MKCQVLILTLVVVCSVSIVGYIQKKKKEEVQLTKLISFQNVKHRVTQDVMHDYENNLVESNSLLEKTMVQVEKNKIELNGIKEAAGRAKNELDTCNGDLKRVTDETAATDSEKTNVNGEFAKKRASYQEQLASVKKEGEQRSKVCDYIKMSDEAKKLCNIEDPPKKEEKKEEVKKEEKKEEVKKEEVKPEVKPEAKPEAPQQAA